jgi:YHS domain-containing protein
MTSRIALLAAMAACLAFAVDSADPKKPSSPPSTSTPKPAAQKVKDPICGMMVDPKTSEKASYEGKTYYFCSRDERVLFEKDPAKYVKK